MVGLAWLPVVREILIIQLKLSCKWMAPVPVVYMLKGASSVQCISQ